MLSLLRMPTDLTGTAHASVISIHQQDMQAQTEVDAAFKLPGNIDEAFLQSHATGVHDDIEPSREPESI